MLVRTVPHKRYEERSGIKVRVTISKKFRFDAAHFLPHHEGKCKNLHGHTWELEVGISAPFEVVARDDRGMMADKGMVMDYAMLKEIVDSTIIERLDHSDLNKIWLNPTSEIICQEIFSRLSRALIGSGFIEERNGRLEFVSLKETPDSMCVVRWD